MKENNLEWFWEILVAIEIFILMIFAFAIL